MSRIISLIVGVYTGFVLDQNFEMPRVPVPSTLINNVKDFFEKITDDKGKKK